MSWRGEQEEKTGERVSTKKQRDDIGMCWRVGKQKEDEERSVTGEGADCGKQAAACVARRDAQFPTGEAQKGSVTAVKCPDSCQGPETWALGGTGTGDTR